MRRILVALLLALAVMPAAAQPSRPPAPRSPQQAPERELTIQNQSGRTIVELYASSTRDSNWGADRLGNDTLAAGRTYRVRFGRTSDCTFDVRVVYDDGSEEETRNHDACRQRQLAFDGSRASGGRQAGGGEEHSFTLANQHSRTVFQVFVGAAGSDEWGEDLLGSETLATGGSSRITFHGACEVRLRIVFDNDAAEERPGVDVCQHDTVTVGPGWTTVDDLASFGGAAAPGQGAGATPAGDGFSLVNRSGKEILIVYVFPDGADNGPDRLGSDVLANGGNVRIRMATGGQCRYTVRIVFSGPDPDEVRSGINLCGMSELVIAPGWADAPLTGMGRIRNSGALPIVELYADPPGAPRGADRLGAATIAVGASLDLPPPVDGQCRFQVTGVFRDGREAAVEADLCAGQEVVLQ